MGSGRPPNADLRGRSARIRSAGPCIEDLHYQNKPYSDSFRAVWGRRAAFAKRAAWNSKPDVKVIEVLDSVGPDDLRLDSPHAGDGEAGQSLERLGVDFGRQACEGVVGTGAPVRPTASLHGKQPPQGNLPIAVDFGEGV